MGEAWITRPAPYGLCVHLDGVAYRAQVVKLFGCANVAVTLEPFTNITKPTKG